MRAIKNFLIFLMLAVVFLGIAYYYGGFRARQELDKNKEIVTSQMILERIQDRYFLVTKTVLWNGEAEIILQDAEGWQGFFIGDKLNTSGSVRIDIGLDFDYFTANDIVIDHVNKNVIVYVPQAEVLDVSIKDGIDVRNKTGLWTGIKEFFAQDSNEDYNRAARELIAQAEEATKKQEEIFIEAREAGIKLIQLVTDSYLPGYRLETRQK